MGGARLRFPDSAYFPEEIEILRFLYTGEVADRCIIHISFVAQDADGCSFFLDRNPPAFYRLQRNDFSCRKRIDRRLERGGKKGD